MIDMQQIFELDSSTEVLSIQPEKQLEQFKASGWTYVRKNSDEV